MGHPKAVEVLTRLTEPFFAQGEPYVYIAMCCDRVYVSKEEAKKCRTCSSPPTNNKVRSRKDIDNPSEALLGVLESIEAKSIFNGEETENR